LPQEVACKISGYKEIEAGDENALVTAIANIGPINVAVDASQESFQFYSSGVYYEKKCSSTLVDLELLTVGYGSEGDLDFFIVKN
jgi:cathepsin L